LSGYLGDIITVSSVNEVVQVGLGGWWQLHVNQLAADYLAVSPKLEWAHYC